MSLVVIYARHLSAALYAKASFALTGALVLVHPNEFDYAPTSIHLGTMSDSPRFI